jgi:UDP-glucose 4-epimerase
VLYFNAADAYPDTGIGEDHDPDTVSSPLVLDAACGDRKAVAVFRYRLRDWMTETRLHPRDRFGKGPRAGIEGAGGGLTHRLFNLRNGCGYSVREVIVSAERVTGHRVPVKLGGKAPGRSGTTDQQFDARAADELH